MILKKQNRQADRKAHPLIGVLLLLIAILLSVLTVPVGLLFGIFYVLRRGPTGIGEYSLKIAVSIDQLGNVIMQHLLNTLWIRKGGYRFGNRDETISSALGRNKQLGTLTGFGKLIDRFLDLVDPDHSLNSIDYYIEPRDVLERLTWIAVNEGKVLVVRYGGKELFEFPGALPVPNTADAVTLGQALHRQLNLQVPASDFRYLHQFEVTIVPGKFLVQTCYTANIPSIPIPQGPIAELLWITSQEAEKIVPQDREILVYLEKGSLI